MLFLHFKHELSAQRKTVISHHLPILLRPVRVRSAPATPPISIRTTNPVPGFIRSALWQLVNAYLLLYASTTYPSR